MGLLGYLETSAIKYQTILCNVPEERRSYLNRGGSLKSRTLGEEFLYKFLGLFRCMAERKAICYVLARTLLCWQCTDATASRLTDFFFVIFLELYTYSSQYDGNIKI